MTFSHLVYHRGHTPEFSEDQQNVTCWPPINLIPTMAPTASMLQSSQAVLKEIERQFTLSDEKLRAIVRHFVDDFNLGLSRYKEPMAMMYAFLPTLHLLPLPDMRKPYICDG